MKPFFMSFPHSGEQVPPEASWLNGLNEVVLMRDVDRYVDRLYEPVVQKLGFPIVKSPWHRYAVDLNRYPEDVDPSTIKDYPQVERAQHFASGIHWRETTQMEVLMREPMTLETHQQLIEKYYWPFHNGIKQQIEQFKMQGAKNVFHIDAHSMPSRGTEKHPDPGQDRAEVVVSDVKGTSCSERFKDLVISAYESVGFQVAYNWPYIGGRITEIYGDPAQGQHTIQVELNRKMYMNEETRLWEDAAAPDFSKRLCEAVEKIYQEMDGVI
ncbi:MAG: N-formylglutamate amidohydrolase [Bdellovibrionales bacterium]